MTVLISGLCVVVIVIPARFAKAEMLGTMPSCGWSQLIRSILVKWPELGSYITNTFSLLVFEVPASQLHGMWSVVLSLRASQPKAL